MTDIKQLPLFEGFQPHASKAKLVGKIDTPMRGMEYGEEVYLIVVGHVRGITHASEGKEGQMVRVHSIEIDEAHELPEERGIVVLTEGQDWSRQVFEKLSGQESLFATEGAE